MFELVTVQNSSLNWQFWIYGPNFPNIYAGYTWDIEPLYLQVQQNKNCYQKSENLENITFLPKNVQQRGQKSENFEFC